MCDGMDDHWRGEVSLLETSLADVKRELTVTQEENVRLRAALAQSELPCVYCTLPKERWSECIHGFPGCDRGDDAVGCPHLGDGLAFEEYRKSVFALILNNITINYDTGEGIIQFELSEYLDAIHQH